MNTISRPRYLLDALFAAALAVVLLCGVALFLGQPEVRRVACSPESLPSFTKTAIRAGAR